MADTLQRQISQHGSPTACLSLGDITFAAAIQRNRSSSSSRSSSLPRARSSSTDGSSDSLFARAASLYLAGIVWAFSSSSPALVRRHTAIAATSVGTTTTTTSGAPGSSAQPAVRDYALICNLIRNLTFVLQKAPFHRRRHHLNSATFIPPETQLGSVHQATLHDTLGVLGWTAPTPEGDVVPGSSVVTSIPTIAYRLSKQFLPALLHAEDEIMSASASSSVRGEAGINNNNSNNGALLSLLGDLSSAAAMAHNARGHSSSSSLAGTDSAADEESQSQSPTSSYPASPELRLRDISRDNDEDEEVLNDSPPTTPSQTSSSDDLAKTFTASRHVAFSNILQERLGCIDTTTSNSKSSVGFPRSNTIDTMSSGISSPVSRRSRASSIRSTASSIFERMCGQPKAKTSISLHTPEQKSTMGSFTPVSAKTAANSLRRFGVHEKVWGARMKSRLGVSSARFWDSDEEEDGGVESDSAAAVGAAPIVAGRRHARSATMDVPAISMTHASFRPESMLDAAVASAAKARIPQAPAPSPVNFNAQTLPRALIPKNRTTSKPSPPIPSISSVLAARPNVPTRSNTDPSGIHGPARGLPKMDPTLAALEKGCRLKAKVSCAVCEKVGWDFPKNRQGMALCSRECRMAFKSAEGKGAGVGAGVVVGVGA